MTLAQDLYFGEDLKETSAGDFSLVDGDEAERQSIFIRLRTPKGSNVFHPWYGNSIYDILSDNIDDTWITRATQYIKECVEQDTKIKVSKIEATVSYEERRVSFLIYYRSARGTSNLTWGESIG